MLICPQTVIFVAQTPKPMNTSSTNTPPSLTIRKATLADLPAIMPIYDKARETMRRTGNPHQWNSTYPSADLIEEDIREGYCHVCLLPDGRVCGTFWFGVIEEPTYAYIEDGAWPDDRPYGVIHRLASDGEVKGIGRRVFEWALAQHPNIRVDTHRDNRVMQHIVTSLGFDYCGVIYVADGSPRLAYRRDDSK